MRLLVVGPKRLKRTREEHIYRLNHEPDLEQQHHDLSVVEDAFALL